MGRSPWLMLAGCVAALPASADPLTITKSVTAVSDILGNLRPRMLPGSVADYKTLVTNPLGNALKPVRNLVLSETLPPHTVMRVNDIATAGKGPIEFADGNLLGTGLLATGLALSWSTTTPATDGVEFYDGASWSYQPVADANGYDIKVKAFRVTLTGSFSAATSFQLRYRVKIS